MVSISQSPKRDPSASFGFRCMLVLFAMFVALPLSDVTPWSCVCSGVHAEGAGATVPTCRHGHGYRWSAWRCVCPPYPTHRRFAQATNPLLLSFSLCATIEHQACGGYPSARDAGCRICAARSAIRIPWRRCCSSALPCSRSRDVLRFLLQCDFCSNAA